MTAIARNGSTPVRRDGSDATVLRMRQPADVPLVERLVHDYEQQLSLAAVAALVDRCREDLAGSPPGAMPELLERLARQRIIVGYPRPAAGDHA